MPEHFAPLELSNFVYAYFYKHFVPSGLKNWIRLERFLIARMLAAGHLLSQEVELWLQLHFGVASAR
jgi:hypothetical protein